MNAPKDISWSTRAFLVTAFLAVTLVALIPDVRNPVRELFDRRPDRKILSTARADILSENLFLTAVKVLTKDGIFLEVYETKEHGKINLLDKVLLPYSRDGWINFRDQHSNLILYDLNGDGRVEFLAPTFDPLRTPHLSVFKLDPGTRTLRRETLDFAADNL